MRISYLLIILLAGSCIVSVVADYGGMLEVETDLPGASLTLDGAHLGASPQLILDVYPGTHLINASLIGYPDQSREVNISAGASEKVYFSFNKDNGVKKPEIVVSECSGPLEQVGISGTSVNMIQLPDGTVVSYYTGPGSGIMCARSHDLKSWQQSDSCLDDPNLTGSKMISSPWVFQVDGKYRMIYLKKDGNSSGFFSATSSDGSHFMYEGPVLFGNNSVERSFSPTRSPTGVSLSDGRIRMYYSNQGGIISAISSDGGRNWTPENGIRLAEAADPSAVLLPDGEVGLFYVDLAPSLKGQKVWYTSSKDGYNFSSAGSIRILESGQTGVWLLDPAVYISSDGNWNLFFNVIGGKHSEGMFTLPELMKVSIDQGCLMNSPAST